jgi:hypothetical protein
LGTPARLADKTRWIEQKTEKLLNGMRWTLLKDTARLKPQSAANLDALIAKMTLRRTARAWSCKKQLRETLERKQINLVQFHDALQGRADEGGRQDDPHASGGPRGLSSDAPDQ